MKLDALFSFLLYRLCLLVAFYVCLLSYVGPAFPSPASICVNLKSLKTRYISPAITWARVHFDHDPLLLSNSSLVPYARVDNISSSNTGTNEAVCNSLNQSPYHLVLAKNRSISL